MNPVEALKMALRALTSNKLRSSLTVLGIVIGVGAVIGLMSIGAGIQKTITEQVQSVGTNLIFVRPGAVNQQGVRSAQGSAATLTLQDAQAIAARVPEVVAVAPQVSFGGPVVAGSQNTFTQINGVTPEYFEALNYAVADGDAISQSNVDARSRVAVLGSLTTQTLFPDGDAVGQSISLSRMRFRVIGVLESKGSGGTGDDLVAVPLTTASQLQRGLTASGQTRVQNINVKVGDASQIAAAKEAIAVVLRDRHNVIGEDDFTVTSLDDLLKAFTQVTQIMSIFLGSIAGISLLVGGIGIMNIMLVSVTERIREIGIRKAVGAKRRDILAQFLFESVVLSLSGGVLGIAVGWLMSKGFSSFSSPTGQTTPVLITPDIIILAVSVAAGIGLFFGIYPASRAAKLDPIQALRYE
ncbi:MAG: ABC transporter permease [Chloroflexi bacterium]|nr:ABC transporter permease [Chloroflexota bacterium]